MNSLVSTPTLTIIRPDDWHLHLRDGEHLRAVLPDTARRFARAIVMPNLKPPVTTTKLALEYRDRVLAALPAGFDPLSLSLPSGTILQRFGTLTEGKGLMLFDALGEVPLPEQLGYEHRA